MTAAFPHPAHVRRLLRALVPVICPPDAVELGVEDDVVDHVGMTMSTVPPILLRGLYAGLGVYDLGARIYPAARGRRAHKLTGEVAEQYFHSWLHGPTLIHRQLATRVMQMMVLAYYEQPAVLDKLGYTPGAWIDDVTRRRLKLYGDDIARAAARVTTSDPLRPGARTTKERI
jgi:hypothetical protein